MEIIKEKTDYLLEVKRKYTYRIFTNGMGEMSVEVQLTDDFKAVTLENYALATMSKEDFNRASTRCINRLFGSLKKRITVSGSH